MFRASVSNLDCFRMWEQSEDLNFEWLRQRILGPFEQTPAMRAGEVFHKALEEFDGSAEVLYREGYTFQIDCDVELIQPDVREMRVSRTYGELKVSGRVDAIFGATVYDHKTTERFDPDRLMDGYQWRFYLDALDLNRFAWNVFVWEEVEFKQYRVKEFHVLEQKRYPNLTEDCDRLARRYLDFAKSYLPEKAITELEITEADVRLVERR